MKIGIIKEFKTPSDKRVVFTPSKCAAVKKLFPKVEFLIGGVGSSQSVTSRCVGRS